MSRPALARLIKYSAETIKRWETSPGHPPPARAQLLYVMVSEGYIKPVKGGATC
jgi:DNA-binding transcriptional regulator YiaG